jgi:hypothetical protein
MAVGLAIVGGVGTALAEQWDGTAWTTVPTASGTAVDRALFSSVSCLSATDCVAVGNQGYTGLTLIEQWNGSTWSVVPSPSP